MAYSFLPPPPRSSSRLLKKRRLKRKNIKIIGALLTAGFIFFVVSVIGAAVAFGYLARDLPSPSKLTDRNPSQSTKIFDRNGKLLYNVFGDQNRTLVTLAKIPKYLQQATIATEDKNFYKHQGFDITGIARSLYDVVVHHKIEGGGSTLTQQLVKNALLTNERTITRKIKEVILAVQIERRYSKDEILQIYLNEIPYGGTAWGSEAASNQYFGKHVSDLSLTECAVLAGLPQLPSAYSPFGPNPKAYIARTTEVLRRMRAENYITKAQQESSIKELPNLKFAAFGQGILAPHFALYVKQLLEDKYGEQKVLQGGLQVTTSLDLDIQNMVQDTVISQINSSQNKNLKVSNGASVVEDTKTGQILAMVGSKDYFATDIPGNYNVATEGLRQPGSSLKPFNYITGFEKGYTPATMWIDQKTDFGGGYTPGNYDDQYHGPLETRYALANSYNIPAVKQLAVNGLDSMIKTLQDFGITTLNDPSKYGLSLTLGGGAIKLNELTNAYAILGNSGRFVTPTAILKVTDSSGTVLYESKPLEPKQVVDVNKVYLIQNILSDRTAKYQAYGTYWANRLNFQENIGVKTGTSENKTDNWTFGFTPSYTVGVWVGNNDNKPMNPALASGVTGAAPIYHDIMVNILKGKPIDKFVRPDGVTDVSVDSVTGQKADSYSTATRTEIFEKTNLPPADDMHIKVRICKPSGLLVTDVCEAAGQAEDRVFTVLYDAYTKQFQNGLTVCNPCVPTAKDSTYFTPIGTTDVNAPTVVISSPTTGQIIPKGNSTFKATVSGSPAAIQKVTFTLVSNSGGPPISPKDSTSMSSPYSANFNVNATGSYTLKVTALDANGNTGTSSSVTFLVTP